MFYQAMTMIYQALAFNLQGRGTRVTIFYQAIYNVLQDNGHVLPGRGPWLIGPWTMSYRAIDHMVQRCRPCATGPRIIFYRAIDHVLPGYGYVLLILGYILPCTMSYRILYDILPGHRPCGTRLWTMYYRAVDTELTYYDVPDRGSCGPWPTRLWTMC